MMVMFVRRCICELGIIFCKATAGFHSLFCRSYRDKQKSNDLPRSLLCLIEVSKGSKIAYFRVKNINGRTYVNIIFFCKTQQVKQKSM